MGLFSSGKSKVKWSIPPQSAEATEARKQIYEMATGAPPDVPLRQIAKLPEMGAERTTARETAMEMIQPQDIFELPEVQGIIDRSVREGNLLANRIGRSLQLSGNTASSTGRDILGRTVSDIESNLTATLAPFAEAQRNRRANLIPVLESLGLTEEERQRGYSQSLLDALFSKEMTEMNMPMQYTFPLLKSVIDLQPQPFPVVQEGQKSLFDQASPLLSAGLAASIMNPGGLAALFGAGGVGAAAGAGAGAAAGAGGITAAGTAAGLTPAMLPALFSDERLKENVKPLDNALEKIKALHAKTYNYITNPNTRDAGIMAQELEQVLPEAVAELNGVKYIKLGAVIALLVNAVKELSKKVE